MLRILIIDGNVLFREGLTNLLQREPGIRVVAEAGSIHESVDKIEQYQPNLALIDADVPGMEECNGIRLLQNQQPQMQIVLMSSIDSPDLLIKAVRSGARGFLTKNHSLSKFMASIHAIERGEAVIPRAMVGRLLDELAGKQEPPANAGGGMLTPREMDVLVEISRGRTNRQISENLMIAENTVKVHVHNILEKLSLSNRRQAARYARMQGIHNPTRSYGQPSQPPTDHTPGIPLRLLLEQDPISSKK